LQPSAVSRCPQRTIAYQPKTRRTTEFAENATLVQKRLMEIDVALKHLRTDTSTLLSGVEKGKN
jgi:hypothetical protein